MEKIIGQASGNSRKVVYIIGAGATQGEALFKGGEPINLLMKYDKKFGGEGIAARVLKKSRLKRKLGIDNNEVDIEKLISLLSTTGNKKDMGMADRLRDLYRKEIVNGLNKIDILNKPTLALCLLDMHRNALFDEKVECLSGIISLNHDNLFQIASQEIHSGLNLGFHFQSDDFSQKNDIPLIIQLHGCFGWLNEHPIKVRKLGLDNNNSDRLLWIPPTILKESKEYPFNKLVGLAYELLLNRCDILRIIGCSLSQNDWNLISLIFNAQHKQDTETGDCFSIELIIGHKDGNNVKKDYSYLHNIIPIGYLKDGDFSDYLLQESYPQDSSELDNPLLYWLKKKVLHHKFKGEIDESTLCSSLKTLIGA